MKAASNRRSAVAGSFYSADPGVLLREVRFWLSQPAKPRAPAFGVMVPHAGYAYSGAICGHALASVEVGPSVLILHTKHQAGGGLLSLADYAAWETPLGNVSSDVTMNEALAGVQGVTHSNAAHSRDHAAEVILPFLQVLRPDVRISVISVGRFEDEDLPRLGSAVANAVKSCGGALIVASSDMNHYESHVQTLAKDEHALAHLAAFDAPGLLETCEREDISMCGAYATALMLEATRALGASRVEILEHTTSGPTSGDYEQVVGYASARVS